MHGSYQTAGGEPPLEELLADPIIVLLLERDGVDPAELRNDLRSLSERLEQTRAAAAARAAAA